MTKLDWIDELPWEFVPNGYPPEAAGPGGPSLLAPVEGVNDSSARLVEGFEPTRYELEVLASHYMDRISEFQSRKPETGQASSTWTRDVQFGLRRLEAIRHLLAQEAFDRAVETVERHWWSALDALLSYVRAQEPCKRCGSHPFDITDVFLMKDDGLCIWCSRF